MDRSCNNIDSARPISNWSSLDDTDDCYALGEYPPQGSHVLRRCVCPFQKQNQFEAYQIEPCVVPVKEGFTSSDEDILENSLFGAPVNYPTYLTESSFLEAKDMMRLWDLISKFIERHLEKQKGISMPRLGIFTLDCQKYRYNIDSYRQKLVPTFVIAGRLALTHRIKRPVLHSTGDVPVIPLNLTTFARILAVSRDRVDMAYNEVIEKVGCMLRAGKKVVLPFRGIGHLDLKQQSVKMVFATDFLNRVKSDKIIKISDLSPVKRNSFLR